MKHTFTAGRDAQISSNPRRTGSRHLELFPAFAVFLLAGALLFVASQKKLDDAAAVSPNESLDAPTESAKNEIRQTMIEPGGREVAIADTRGACAPQNQNAVATNAAGKTFVMRGEWIEPTAVPFANAHVDLALADLSSGSGDAGSVVSSAFSTGSTSISNLAPLVVAQGGSGSRGDSAILATDASIDGTGGTGKGALSANAVDGETDWKNAGGTDWNTGANWTAISGSAPPIAGDVAWFKTAFSSGQPNLSVSTSIAGFYFNGVGTSGYDITSSSTAIKFTLTGSSISAGTLTEVGDTTANAIRADNTSLSNIIDAPIILGGAIGTPQAFYQARGGTLVINGAISSTNAITGLQLITAGSGQATFTLAGANTYSGSTTIANLTTTLNINNASAISSGTLFFSAGGTIDNTTANAITLSNANNITLSGGSLTFTGTKDLSFGNNTTALSASLNRSITTTAGTLTIGAVVGGGAALTFTKAGGGTLVTTGTSTYSSLTAVTGGTLLVNGNSSGATGAMTVNGSGTVLGGTGTIGSTTVTLGNLTPGAIINPGSRGTGPGTASSVGTLTMTGALTLTSANTFHVDASGTLTSNWDKLAANGVTLGTTSTLQLSIASGLTFTNGTVYTLIDNTSASAISGTFSSIAEGSTVSSGGYNFLASYIGGTGNDFTLTAVPEPSTWIASALALAVIGYQFSVVRRKRCARVLG